MRELLEPWGAFLVLGGVALLLMVGLGVSMWVDSRSEARRAWRRGQKQRKVERKETLKRLENLAIAKRKESA